MAFDEAQAIIWDWIDKDSLEQSCRAFLRAELSKTMTGIIAHGANVETVTAIRAIPELFCLTDQAKCDFGEAEKVARALEFGSLTLQVPKMELQTKLAGFLEEELNRHGKVLFGL